MEEVLSHTALNSPHVLSRKARRLLLERKKEVGNLLLELDNTLGSWFPR